MKESPPVQNPTHTVEHDREHDDQWHQRRRVELDGCCGGGGQNVSGVWTVVEVHAPHDDAHYIGAIHQMLIPDYRLTLV